MLGSDHQLVLIDSRNQDPLHKSGFHRTDPLILQTYTRQSAIALPILGLKAAEPHPTTSPWHQENSLHSPQRHRRQKMRLSCQLSSSPPCEE